MFVCLFGVCLFFRCLFVCLIVCLFVRCLFACYLFVNWCLLIVFVYFLKFWVLLLLVFVGVVCCFKNDVSENRETVKVAIPPKNSEHRLRPCGSKHQTTRRSLTLNSHLTLHSAICTITSTKYY